MSGSIHADGISGAVYDFGAEELNPIELLFPEEQLAAAGVAGAEYYSPTILAYEENVQFMEEALILLLGGDRDMQTGKVLSRLSFEDVWTQELLHTGGPAPSNPVATEDGSRLFFCGATDTEPYRYPLRRQLYVLDCADGNVTQLTDDETYTCESPILCNSGKTLMFGRIDKEGGMSLWRATSDGSGLAKLADLHANAYVPFEQPVTSETGEGPEPDYSGYPTAYEDFYGRGSWYDMLAVR